MTASPQPVFHNKVLLERTKIRPKFSRFRDLHRDLVNVDFQVHTNQTDGKATASQILIAAQERGIQAIGFTEHVRRDTRWFPEFQASIKLDAERFPDIVTYVGAETKAMDISGTLDISPDILLASQIVLGSVHRFPDASGGYVDFKTMSARETADMEFQLALGMALNAPIDVLAHPGGMYERRHGVFPETYFRELMAATLERGIAIEINSSYLVNPKKFIELCDEINPIVSIGSDVHSLDEIGKCRDMLWSMGVGRA